MDISKAKPVSPLKNPSVQAAPPPPLDPHDLKALALANDQAKLAFKSGSVAGGIALNPPDPGVLSFSRSQGDYAVEASFDDKSQGGRLQEATVVLDAKQSLDKQTSLKIKRNGDGTYAATVSSGQPPQTHEASTQELKRFRSAIQSLFADADKEGVVVSLVPGVPNAAMDDRPKRDALLYYLHALPQAPAPEKPRHYAIKHRPDPMIGGVATTLFKKDNKTPRLTVAADFNSKAPGHPLKKASVVTNPTAAPAKQVQLVFEQNPYGELVGRAFVGGKERPFTLDDVASAWNAIREAYSDDPKICNALLFDLERIKDYPLPD